MNFSPGTDIPVECVGMIGGRLTKFVDTPGLLDPNYINISDFEYERLAKAILAVPNGIHALGVVIKIGDRTTSTDAKIYENLLAFIELTPYVFVIFSNANKLGKTHEEQHHNFQIMLSDVKTPKILHKLLEKTNNRYMILESLLNNEGDYYDNKVDELMKIVDSIIDKQKKPFDCFLNEVAREMLRNAKSQQERIDALTAQLKEKKRQLWKTVCIFLGVTLGAGAGTLVGGPVGAAMGANLGTGAVATLIGAGAVSGAIGGYGTEEGVNKCRTQ